MLDQHLPLVERLGGVQLELERESAMSRLRMVSWPIRSLGPNAACSVRSIDSFSGW